jgi:8-oxo-dGTP pyrophosphatase MutT (NUDIX family)
VSELGPLLAGFRVADPVIAAHVRAVRDLVAAVPDPCDRGEFRPGHLTASAFVLSADGASVLLVLHRRLGRWLQPGGHIDPVDPDPEAAARREVAEETGVVATGPGRLVDVDVHRIPAGKGEPPHRHFDLRFLYRRWHGEPRPGDGAADVAWAPLDELAVAAGDVSLRRAARRILVRAPKLAAGLNREEA